MRLYNSVNKDVINLLGHEYCVCSMMIYHALMVFYISFIQSSYFLLFASTAVGFLLADKLVLSKVRAALGLDQLKVGLTGAAPIRVDTLEFFGALGAFCRKG